MAPGSYKAQKFNWELSCQVYASAIPPLMMMMYIAHHINCQQQRCSDYTWNFKKKDSIVISILFMPNDFISLGIIQMASLTLLAFHSHSESGHGRSSQLATHPPTQVLNAELWMLFTLIFPPHTHTSCWLQ